MTNYRITTFLKQTKFRSTNQKNSYSSRSVYEKIDNYFATVLADDKRFNTYFNKRFPRSYKYLPKIRLVALLLIFITVRMDYQTSLAIFSSVIEEKSSIPDSPNFYTKYSFYFFIAISIYEFVLAVYVILKANSPIRNYLYQAGKHGLRLVGAASVVTVGYSKLSFVEPDSVTNFVHTKTFFGRGYDYAIGSFCLKAKGDLISGALGKADMMSAVQKHAPDSNIIDLIKLNNIINDPEFKFKIRENTTIFEKVFIGISFVDSPSLPTNLEGSVPTNPEGFGFSDLNSLNGDDNTDTEESVTPVTENLPIRRHFSDPLPRTSNTPVIQRHNTR